MPFEIVDIRMLDKKLQPTGLDVLDGNLIVGSNGFGNMIIENRVPGYKGLSKFGHDSTATNSDIEVWDGSAVYVYPSTATTAYISSSAAGDTQVYEIHGINEEWDEVSVNVTASGVTFVAIPGLWMRIFRVKNMGATDNAGTIYVSSDNTDVGGDGVPDNLADIMAQITIARNQTLMCIWAVPKNFTAFVTQFYASTSAATTKTVEIVLWTRPFGGVFQAKKVFSIHSGTTQEIVFPFPLPVDGKSDIRITANASGASEVSAGFDLYYRQDMRGIEDDS